MLEARTHLELEKLVWFDPVASSGGLQKNTVSGCIP